jgi:hypothetical protein
MMRFAIKNNSLASDEARARLQRHGPRLRQLLGLEPLTLEMLTLVSAAALLTGGMADAYSRFALAVHPAQASGRIS